MNNPHLLYVPAIGFMLSLLVIRIKKRYVEQGVLFRRIAAQSRDSHAAKSGGGDKPKRISRKSR
ncbi:hypothetical protein B0G80_7533 [Paraburkholderia sp. BL6669N2]|nr:hypothetical protein B0G80_7533 [Paraburkholderia sp. BL6669N2]